MPEEARLLVCLQCALAAMIDGVPDPAIEETVEAHMARRHPDPDVLLAERLRLEAAMALWYAPTSGTH
jgi:hypothetical protein